MDIKDSYLHSAIGVVKSIDVGNGKLTYRLADVGNTPITFDLTKAGVIPFIIGNHTQETVHWTGTASSISELYDGLTIRYWVPYNSTGAIDLNLTLSTGTKTGQIECYYRGLDRLTTHVKAGSPVTLTYRVNPTISGVEYNKSGWWMDADNSGSVFKKHTSANAGGYDGLVPVPSYTTTSTRFLREDGTWVVPTDNKVLLSVDSNSKFRCLLLGTTQYESSPSSPTAITGLAYITKNIYVDPSKATLYADTFVGKLAYTNLTGSTTTANQAIVSSGTANGWTLKTLGSNAFNSTAYLPLSGGTMIGSIVMPTGTYIHGVNENGGAMLMFDGTRTILGSVGDTSTGHTHIRSRDAKVTVGVGGGASYILLHTGNYSTTLDERYYTESEIDTKLGNYVTTDTNLIITGIKNFATNSNANPLKISRNGGNIECLNIGADDLTSYFHFVQDEKTANFKFIGEWNDTENSDGSNAGSKYVSFLLSNSNAKIELNDGINTHTVLHSGIAYIKDGKITINGTSITPLTSHLSLANYVTLDGTLTITGLKTFEKPINLNYTYNNKANIIFKNNRVGKDGYADNIIQILDSDLGVVGNLGMHGSPNGVSFYYLGHTTYDGLNLRVYKDTVKFGNYGLLYTETDGNKDLVLLSNGDGIPVWANQSSLNVGKLNGCTDAIFYKKGLSNNYTTNKSINDINKTSESELAWNVATNTNLKLVNSNNALAIIIGGEANQRKAMILVGHSDTLYANYLGELHLNPLGGNVFVNGVQLYASRTFTIGDTAKSLNDSADITWTPSEIGYKHEWKAKIQCATWSRLCYIEYWKSNIGSSYIININGTRNSVVYNYTYLVTAHHGGGYRSNIVQLGGSNYSNISVRTCVDSQGNSYFELYDTARNATFATIQTIQCILIPIACGKITKYVDSFIDGTTIPSGYITGTLLDSKAYENSIQATNFVGSLIGNVTGNVTGSASYLISSDTSTDDTFATYVKNYITDKGVNTWKNTTGAAIGDVPNASTVLNVGSSSSRFFRLISLKGSNLYYQTPNDSNNGWAAKRTILDSANSYITDGKITINGNSITPITSLEGYVKFIRLQSQTSKLLSDKFNVIGASNKGDDSTQSECPTNYGAFIAIATKADKNSGFLIYGDTSNSNAGIYYRARQAGDSNTDYLSWRRVLDENNYANYVYSKTSADSTFFKYKGSINNAVDFNSLRENGIYWNTTGNNAEVSANAPSSYGYLLNFATTNNNYPGALVHVHSHMQYRRGWYNSTSKVLEWSSWKTVLDSDNYSNYTYSKSQTDDAISKAIAGLVGSAPETLDTIEEISKYLQNGTVVESITNSLAGKVSKAGDTMTGALKINVPNDTTTGLELISTITNVSIAMRCKISDVIHSGFIVYRGGSTYSVTDNAWKNSYNILHAGNYTSYKHAYTNLTGSGTTANQAIVSTGTKDGWTLKTLGSRAFDSTAYLPIAGGTMGGNITMPKKSIVVTSDSTSNYVQAIKFYKGTTGVTEGYDANIGWHNTEDTDGAIILIPHATTSDPWSSGVGLYISKTRLKYNNSEVLHSINYTDYTVKQDGTGASGTWGINITGNANTATKLATARTIWGQSFDGSGNVDGKLTITSGGMLVTGTAYFGGGTAYYFGKTGDIECHQMRVNDIALFKSTVKISNSSNPLIYFCDSVNSGQSIASIWYVTNYDEENKRYGAGRFAFRLLSYTSGTSTKLSAFERYYLPSVETNLTENKNYYILTSKNYSDYLGYIGTTAVQSESKALELTGITNLTISATDSNSYIKFSRAKTDSDAYGINYILAPTNGLLALGVGTNASNYITAIIDPTSVRPYATGRKDLGTNALYWRNTYTQSIYILGSASSPTCITANNENNLYFTINNEIPLVLSTTEVRPGTGQTNKFNLGTSSVRWKNVYATTFDGYLDGNAKSAYTLKQESTNRPTSCNTQYTDSCLRYYLSTSSLTTGRPMGDGYILHAGWDNTGFNTLLYLPHEGNSLQYRTSHNATFNNWITILDGKNYLATYSTKTSNETGYYKIAINSEESWMLGFIVRIYANYKYYDLRISGYNYGTLYWHAPLASLVHGTDALKVIFGYDAAWKLWVAIPASYYTGISILDVVNGYTQTNMIPSQLFTITRVDSLTGTSQVTKNVGFIGVTSEPRAVYNNGTNAYELLHTGNISSYRGYIGTTAVQASSAAQGLSGITNLSMSGVIGINNTTGNSNLGTIITGKTYKIGFLIGSDNIHRGIYDYTKSDWIIRRSEDTSIILGGDTIPTASSNTSLSAGYSLGNPSYIWKQLYVRQIITNGANSSYHNGRNLSAFKVTTGSGYVSAISLKTTNGSWDIGTYDNFPDALLYTFVPDDSYNGNTNSGCKYVRLMLPTSNEGIIAYKSDITKSQVGLDNVQNTAFYLRKTNVNGENWNMAGTTNGDAFTIFAPTTAGSLGQVLISNGSGAPTWGSPSGLTAGSLTTLLLFSGSVSVSSSGWTDLAGATFTNIATGTYAVQVVSGTDFVASGIFSVYKNLSNTSDEIPLHVCTSKATRIYLRTTSNKLQIASNDLSATSWSITIKIAKIL